MEKLPLLCSICHKNFNCLGLIVCEIIALNSSLVPAKMGVLLKEADK